MTHIATPLAARRAVGITQQTLAEWARCSAMTVWKCEKDGVFPAIFDLRKRYIKALRLPPGTMAPNEIEQKNKAEAARKAAKIEREEFER